MPAQNKNLELPGYIHSCLCTTYHNRRYGLGTNFKCYANSFSYNAKKEECNHTSLQQQDMYTSDDGMLVNLYGRRGDNLQQFNQTKDILFAGCSFTYGAELHDDKKIWSRIVKDYFYPEGKLFNIGRSGLNTTEIIFDLYKTLNLYGNPKKIFLLIPEIHREGIPYLERTVNKEDLEFINLSQTRTVVSCLVGLEAFCKVKKIELVYASWDLDSSLELKKHNLENFVNIYDTPDDILFYLKDLMPELHWSEKHNKRFAETMIRESNAYTWS